MPCLSEGAREKLLAIGEVELIDSLERDYAEVLKRRREVIEFGNPAQIDEIKRAKANLQLIQQAQLHRTERLIASSGTMISENNVYGLVLMVRAHFESTAIVGYLCDRIASYSKGNIAFDRIIFDIAYALMGAKHETFKNAPDPPNILTCIEKADRYLRVEKGVGDEPIIADCYAWLSDFAHPNFNSHDASFRLNKALNRFETRHDEALSKDHVNLIGYLAISTETFLEFYDDLERLSAVAFDK